MKIKGVCGRDGREFLVQQVVDSGGHCPWDGLPFQPDYTGSLTEALVQVERAGSALEEALERIVAMEPAFSIEADSMLRRVQVMLDDLGRRAGRAAAPRA